MKLERAIIIKGKTRLESLLDRFNSKSQAKFYIEHNGGDFTEYEAEHNTFYEGLLQVQSSVSKALKSTLLERNYLSSFLFDESDLIVVVGQDGLVANTAKYVGSCPLLAINPDVKRNVGTLLPYNTMDFEDGLKAVLQEKAHIKQVTLAQARMNDGQELLAFNDFYIGKSNHTSSRYKIRLGEQGETQSSSGVIVSTAAGATGWLSSVFNEYRGISKFCGQAPKNIKQQIALDDNKLCFIVREPFNSDFTQTDLVAGYIHQEEVMTLESNMPENGVIFSDGVIDDFLVFNAGSTLSIGLAEKKVNLIMK